MTFDLRKREGPLPIAYTAAFADDAASPSAELRVTIPGFDQGRHVWGPVVWAPRVGAAGEAVYPARGDRALVIFSDERTPWVVAWSPS